MTTKNTVSNTQPVVLREARTIGKYTVSAHLDPTIDQGTKFFPWSRVEITNPKGQTFVRLFKKAGYAIGWFNEVVLALTDNNGKLLVKPETMELLQKHTASYNQRRAEIATAKRTGGKKATGKGKATQAQTQILL